MNLNDHTSRWGGQIQSSKVVSSRKRRLDRIKQSLTIMDVFAESCNCSWSAPVGISCPQTLGSALRGPLTRSRSCHESHGRSLPAMRNTSPSASLKPSTSALNMPWRRLLPSASRTGSSLPMVGRTLSLADRLTKSAKGISQTQRPKYEAISVKEGISGCS
jgi:hypothetical protein